MGLKWTLGWSVAAALATCLLGSPARADDHQARTVFGTPRVSWTTAPPLRLQPEGARLVLVLPDEWMPPPDFGRLGVPLDPNKHWEFRHASCMTRWTIGTRVHLHVTDRSRAVDFGLSLLPRAAIATLRFDPTARWD